VSGRHIALPVAAVAAVVLAGCTSSSRHTYHGTYIPGAPTDTTSASTGVMPAPTTSDPPTRPPASSSERAPTQRFTIAFAGDVHFSGRVLARLQHDPATVFGPAAAVLSRADLTMVNLETAITTGGVQQDKAFTFRAPPSALTALRDAGIDVATMANNHGADYGQPGLRDSLAAIRASHFPVIGIGADAKQAFAPYKTTLNGTKVAIFAADRVQDETTLSLFSAGADKPGVANAHDPRLLGAVRRARRDGYVVVVYLHWGVEYQTCPSGDQTSFARDLAEAGASAVIGTHPHVLQGGGWLPDGAYVEYSTGNFLWWMSFGNNQDDNGVFTLSFDHGHVVKDDFAPAHLDDRGVPVPAIGAEKQRIHDEWVHDRSCTGLAAAPPG
jgi:poly-gamma-glutamate synthesis protein (capsule biosynthesis protein)